jgi:hypothetical protein
MKKLLHDAFHLKIHFDSDDDDIFDIDAGWFYFAFIFICYYPHVRNTILSIIEKL